MDERTRRLETHNNPAALLALMWYHATEGKGKKDMVILPYKDRLELFARYLQQLVMESLGKEKDLQGNIVHQGIAVYGNKGSTDQHAYVQQLREGVLNFFVTFIQVLRDREGRHSKWKKVSPSATICPAFCRARAVPYMTMVAKASRSQFVKSTPFP
jgi:glucose-6-phosphate isomerase